MSPSSNVAGYAGSTRVTVVNVPVPFVQLLARRGTLDEYGQILVREALAHAQVPGPWLRLMGALTKSVPQWDGRGKAGHDAAWVM